MVFKDWRLSSLKNHLQTLFWKYFTAFLRFANEVVTWYLLLTHCVLSQVLTLRQIFILKIFIVDFYSWKFVTIDNIRRKSWFAVIASFSLKSLTNVRNIWSINLRYSTHLFRKSIFCMIIHPFRKSIPNHFAFWKNIVAFASDLLTKIKRKCRVSYQMFWFKSLLGLTWGKKWKWK